MLVTGAHPPLPAAARIIDLAMRDFVVPWYHKGAGGVVSDDDAFLEYIQYVITSEWWWSP